MKVRVAWKTTARDSRTLQDRTTNQIEFSESSAETFGYRCLGILTPVGTAQRDQHWQAFGLGTRPPAASTQ